MILVSTLTIVRALLENDSVTIHESHFLLGNMIIIISPLTKSQIWKETVPHRKFIQRTDLLFVFSFSVVEQSEGERLAGGERAERAVSRQVRKVRMLSPGGKLRCGCWTPSTPTHTSRPLPH